MRFSRDNKLSLQLYKISLLSRTPKPSKDKSIYWNWGRKNKIDINAATLKEELNDLKVKAKELGYYKGDTDGSNKNKIKNFLI